MDRKTTRDFHPEVLRLFDRYVHGQLDRRGFLQAAAGFAAGASGAAGLLAALSPQFVQARQVEPDDPRLATSRPRFESPMGYGEAGGYLVRPTAETGPLPLVLVVHETAA
ncbi:MAG TPA: hypothetical protein VIM90_08105 [Arenimonas sp.]